MTVLIIGAGASGMAAALTASENEETRVLLLERQARVGRKLLSTGNGRCNLANLSPIEGRYHGEDPAFCLPALSRFDAEDDLAYFQKLGLLTVTEPSGRVYPLSDHAGSVVDVLRFALEKPNIELRLGERVTFLEPGNGGFSVQTETERLSADKVIVACGGCAGEKLGGVKDGYTLLRELGHRRTGLYPALTQVRTGTKYPRALKGVKADCRITLLAGRHRLCESAGELLFTETGVSGPAVFDLSRAVSAGGAGLALSLDFLRNRDEAEVSDLLRERCARFPALPADTLFTGKVHNRLGKMLCQAAALPQGPLSLLSEEDLARAVRAAKDFRLPVLGTAGFESAQVTAGGMDTSQFDPETLESRLCPGLFACGEVLDIDGDCGGFNLLWAWSSGRLAGRLGT